MSDKAELERRRALSNDAAMADAESLCVPCKLCGGKARISDAGSGWGYYIRCEGVRGFRPHLGCMVSEQRLSGWAYNVMEWWNRLHSQPPAPSQGEVGS
jgi:hypothetical protein